MEKIIMILDKFVAYLLVLMDTEVIYFKPIDLLVVTAMAVGIYFFVKYSLKAFFKYAMYGVKAGYQPARRLYDRHRLSRKNRIVCGVCKNPLHSCTCRSNHGVSYKTRLKNWKKKHKAIIKAEATRMREQRELNKPIELKAKRRRDGGR